MSKFGKVSEIRRTSAEWAAMLGAEVINPLGWDRTNFIFSWHVEEITREEFDKRYLNSEVDPRGYRPPRHTRKKESL